MSKDRLIIKWQPQPKQKIVLENPAFELMFGGSKGPGKTDEILADATRYLPNPRYRGIIFRRTYPKMSEMILRTHELFHGIGRWSEQKRTWTFPNIYDKARTGATIKFMHMESEDDKYNIQGHEYQYMAFDQLEEFTETQYRFAILQCRSTVDGLRPYVRSTANPIGVGHAWVKARFIDKCKGDGSIKFFKLVKTIKGEVEIETTPDDPKALSRAFVQATVYDNKILLEKDPQYLRILDTLPEDMRKALKDGDWNALIGMYFKEWNQSVHVIPLSMCLARAAVMPVTRYIALDYGFRAPSSVGWYAVFPDGQAVRYREHYVEGRTYEALAHEILALSRSVRGAPEKIEYMVADPAIWGDIEHHREPKDGQAQGENGFNKMAAVFGDRFPIIRADNRRVVGWTRCRESLTPYKDQHNQMTAPFLVTDNCTNFIRTIVGLVHDKTKIEDLDTHGEDHPQDEWRYFTMSRTTAPRSEEAAPIDPAEDFWDRVRADQKVHDIKQSESVDAPVEHEVMEEGTQVIED